MRNFIIPIIASALLSPAMASTSSDCQKVSAIAKSLIETTPEKVLTIVEAQLSEHPRCSCEIVKIVIQSTHADVELVAKIVETSILAAPDQMRIIAQCAIAVAPDALPAIQAVLAKLDPHSGESYAAKHSGKGGKEVGPSQEEGAIANPLDFPGIGAAGPGSVDPLGGLTDGALPGGGDPFTAPVFPGGFPTSPVRPPVETPVNP